MSFGGEVSPNVLFRPFQIYESCSVPKFQEARGEMRIKRNGRGDLSIKECLMAEDFSSHNTLALENKWIAHDPKSVAFIQSLSKAETIFKNHSKEDDRGGDKGGKFKKGKKSEGNNKHE